ncbi:hypothetical protein TUN199_08404 [Pyrenophora tritici-repentis]|nr:hypothetical protein Alg130_08286 [Pyrenophora tritici-repentis]KAI0619602.1 hypothetical protein TUN199_08404 [Pyrenophora tritici-repentis]
MSTSKSSWLDSYRLQITDNIEARAQWHVPENAITSSINCAPVTDLSPPPNRLEAREPGGESPLIYGFVAVTVTLNYLRHWYLRDHSDGRFAAIVDYNDETDMVTITVGIVTRPGDDWESVDFTIDPDYQYFDSPRSHQTETVPQLRDGRNVHANYRVSDIENYIRREGHHIQGSIEDHEFEFRVDYVISRR